MNDPIIVSKKRSLKTFNLICLSIGVLAVAVFCLVVDVINNGYFEHYTFAQSVLYILEVPCKLFLPPVLLFMAICNFLFFISDFSITVYDDKIVGQGWFKKQVSLPTDSITAAAVCFFHGIAIGTSSGRISFWMIENNKEIYKEINKIIENRQKNKVIVPQQIVNQTTSAQELKEYKELLDAGIISQEEFDTKKKQLLGL